MKKALVCGLNHFKNYPQDSLAGCIPDAASMEHFLAGLGPTETTLIDNQATKANAMAQLAALVGEAKTGNLSYLAFTWSGHGTHYPRPEEPDGLGEALVCYDLAEKNGDWDSATIIKDKELHDLFNQVPPSCIVEVWLDTCFSGGMDKDVTFYKARWLSKRQIINRFLHNPANSAGQMRMANSGMNQGLNSNIIMWCACSEAQTSADAYIAGGAHGAFTYYWTEMVKTYPKASRVELLVKSRTALQRNGYEQVPRLKCWNKAAQGMVGQ